MGKLWRNDEVLDAKELVLPGVTPANLKLDGRYRSALVTSDMYNICNRLAELNPRLMIHELVDTFTGEHAYCIMEQTPDGDKLVFKTKELDARVLEEVRYLMSVPFEYRYAQSLKLIEKLEAEAHQKELDELYENLGRQMLSQFEHDGFIETRGISYPKRGVKPRD